MAILELHVHTTCRVKERSWTQSHLLKCYRLWQVDFSIALFFASNLIRFYEKYSIPLNYNVGIWADLCIQITLDRTLYHTPFLSQRIGDTFKLSQIPKYNFLFYLETVLQKLKFPYAPNLSNWTIVKNKNRGYNIFILIACSIINWRPFQFFRHATLMISNNQRNKKNLFYI